MGQWRVDVETAEDSTWTYVGGLEFPIRSIWTHAEAGVIVNTLTLGYPDTTERDLQPLRPGQFVVFDSAFDPAMILEVGEGTVTLMLRPFGNEAWPEPRPMPSRLIRREQWTYTGDEWIARNRNLWQHFDRYPPNPDPYRSLDP